NVSPAVQDYNVADFLAAGMSERVVNIVAHGRATLKGELLSAARHSWSGYTTADGTDFDPIRAWRNRDTTTNITLDGNPWALYMEDYYPTMQHPDRAWFDGLRLIVYTAC